MITEKGRLKCKWRTQPSSCNAGSAVQPLPIDKAIPGVWIHGEIANLKCGKVLEEVAALRRGDAKIAEAGLDDHARTGNLVPRDWNAEPRFVRSPSTYADQHVWPELSRELGVEGRDTLRHLVAARPLKAMEVDGNDIAQIRRFGRGPAPVRSGTATVPVRPSQRAGPRPRAKPPGDASEGSRTRWLTAALARRTANSISTGRPRASSPMLINWSRICGQREHPVFQDGRETHDARSWRLRPS